MKNVKRPLFIVKNQSKLQIVFTSSKIPPVNYQYDSENSFICCTFVIMNLRSVFALLILGSVLVLYACCKAGTGGKANIICHVKNTNTGANGNNFVVYVYYGSSKPPATLDKFDAHQSTGANNSTVTFSGMKCGVYYLYAVGYDSLAGIPLKGGGPFSLSHANRNKTENATISVSY